MTDKELLEAAKAIYENCMNKGYCEGCPFEHKGETYLDNFCILQETICCCVVGKSLARRMLNENCTQ